MKIKINKIKAILNELEKDVDIDSVTIQHVPETLKAILIDRFVHMGGSYNPDFIDDTGAYDYKKFFAFKHNDITKVSIAEIFERADYLEGIIKQNIQATNIPIYCLEFNLPKLESLRDKDAFSDLVRGMFLYRRVL